MHNSWVSPRVGRALDQLAKDRQRLVREYQQLAASYEDGAAGRSKDSWLAAKHFEHFASYIASYDSSTIRYSLWECGRLASARMDNRERDKRARWRAFLRKL
jgi:hypothetical protein